MSVHFPAPARRGHDRARLAFLLSVLSLLAACGGGHGGGGFHGPSTPTLTVAAAPTSVTTAQTVTVDVSVTGQGGAPTAGTVTLTSGAFSAGSVVLNAGAAAFTIPAGVLPVGSDALSVQYVPSSAASYTAASGSATVTVSAATNPTVAAQSSDILVSGHPFSAIPAGSNLLVSVTNNGMAGSQATGVNVYTAASPSQLTFKCTQNVTPAAAESLTLSPDGSTLAVAAEIAGMDFLNAGATTSACNSGETLVSQGTVVGQGGSTETLGAGTFDVAFTPDGKYAFVANEYGVVAQDSTGANIEGDVAVVALTYGSQGEISSGSVLGEFSTGGQAIANVTMSPDGSRLYVTSEVDRPGITVSGTANSTLAHGGCMQTITGPNGQPETITTTYGLLTVVDVAKAETTPTAAAIIATVASGCSPVRVVETSDQQVIWVAARGDNNVLAFSTHMLEASPDNALLGFGNTGGIAPVGLQLFHNQQLLAVANSNRFATDEVGNMTIMNATPVNPTVLTTVAASYFPRSISVGADQSTLYLTDYNGGRVQIITNSVK